MRTKSESVAVLKSRAIEASGNSYSPYSKFRVGAAVMDQAGRIYVGCNVENASYGLTQCAERNAAGAAIAGGCSAGSLMAMVIYLEGDIAHPPCGACRQVMHELMAAEGEVISCCDSDERKVWTRDEYLPDPFVFPERS